MIFLLVRKKRCPQAFFFLSVIFFFNCIPTGKWSFLQTDCSGREHEVGLSFVFFRVLYVKGWVRNYFAATAAAGFPSSKLMIFISGSKGQGFHSCRRAILFLIQLRCRRSCALMAGIRRELFSVCTCRSDSTAAKQALEPPPACREVSEDKRLPVRCKLLKTLSFPVDTRCLADKPSENFTMGS